MDIINEFFGIDGYERSPEGYMSKEHLIFASVFTLIMLTLSVFLALKDKNKDDKKKNLVLIVSAILIDSTELIRIIVTCIKCEDPLHWVYMLPLFLCSIHFITIPVAAFSKGRIRESAIDFTAIFGILGAVMGTYFAGNIYSSCPVISFDSIVSGLTHCIAGFVSLYVIISKTAKLERRNIPITISILGVSCIAAYIANIFTDCNYMFLSRGDGTPYDIVYNWVDGHPFLYPLIVVLLFIIYIFAFYFVYYGFKKRYKKS